MANSKISILDLSELSDGAIYDIDALYLGGVAADNFITLSGNQTISASKKLIVDYLSGSFALWGTVNGSGYGMGVNPSGLYIHPVTDNTAGSSMIITPFSFSNAENGTNWSFTESSGTYTIATRESDNTFTGLNHFNGSCFTINNGSASAPNGGFYCNGSRITLGNVNKFLELQPSGIRLSYLGLPAFLNIANTTIDDTNKDYLISSEHGALSFTAEKNMYLDGLGGLYLGTSKSLNTLNVHIGGTSTSLYLNAGAVYLNGVSGREGQVPMIQADGSLSWGTVSSGGTADGNYYHTPTYTSGALKLGESNYVGLGPMYVPWASFDTPGVVRTPYETTGTALVGTTSVDSTVPSLQPRTTIPNKYYGIERDANGLLFVNVPWTDTNTYVTQYYGTGNGDYPLLMSYVPGITSTSSRGGAYAYVNNGLFANPSTSILTATGGITTPNIYTTDSGLTFYVGEDSDPFAQLLWSSEAADEDPEANNRGITTFDTSSYALVFRANDSYGNNANIRIEGGNGGLSTQISLNADTIYANGALNLTNASIQANGSIGTAGQVLTSTGSGVEWAAVDLNNYVTLNTMQTIDGLKAFSGTVGFTNVVSFGSNCQIWVNGRAGNGNQTLVSDRTGTYWDTHIKGYNNADLSSRFSQLVMYVDSNGYLHISAT